MMSLESSVNVVTVRGPAVIIWQFCGESTMEFIHFEFIRLFQTEREHTTLQLPLELYYTLIFFIAIDGCCILKELNIRACC